MMADMQENKQIDSETEITRKNVVFANDATVSLNYYQLFVKQK